MINWISRTDSIQQDELTNYRNRIFHKITLTLVIIGSVAYILGIYASIKYNLYSIAIIDTIAYSLLVTILVYRRLNIIIKKLVLLTITLVLALVFMFVIGPGGPGFVYLIGFNLLVSLLFGLRATYISLATTLLILLSVTGIIYYNLFPEFPIANYGTVGYLAAGINVILISSISSLPFAFLVQNLEKRIISQKQMQKQLYQNVIDLSNAKKKAEEADELKSSFLANMSHEIRTPLNTILGFSQLLVQQPNIKEEERKEFLSIVNDSGHYLLNIIDNIMDISMIEANQLKFFIHEVNLNDIFSELKNLYHPNINEKKSISVAFHNKYENDNIILHTDSKRLKQVFVNLINNAIKFTHKGEIIIGCTIRMDIIEFFVQDYGKGIKESNLKSIFNRFIKEQDNVSENSNGTGLGLPISKGILKALGGEIWVHSSLGKGSTFHFTIPFSSHSQVNFDKVENLYTN